MVDFFKVSGSGNDFIALVEPPASPTPDEIRAWCRRGVSLGADGLFVLRRSGEAAVMDYWNADGTAAGLCLNGTRCAARLAFHLGWAAEQVVIATGAGALPCRRAGEARVAVEVPPPTAPPELLSLEVDGQSHAGWRVQVGVPHLVVPWPESLTAAPVEALGRRLRNHPALAPNGSNVDFVRFPEPRTLEIRSYERGVEAETLACGTGVLAAAAVGLLLGRVELPLAAHTLGGFPLGVEGEADPRPGGGWTVRRWSLTGDARIIASGQLVDASRAVPASPGWR